MIIGITGNYAAGKDTMAEVLEKMNFTHYSFSDVLREELKKQNKEVTRDNLFIVGNALRVEHGPGILAQLALDKVEDGENYTFTSIRNPSEVQLLQKRADFLLVNITAPEKERLRRLIERNRESDPKSLDELRTKEKKENSNDPNSQQLDTVASMAKVTVGNDKTFEILKIKTHQLIKDWIYKLQDQRPSWDEYFMNIAEEVKSRASCMSSKKAAIIVKNKMIISTGYNGSPKGIKHCTSGGCQRCLSRHLGKLQSGSYSEPCICAHAEENAIVQAAFNGVSTSGAVMYTTFTPCTTCSKMIINAGISSVIAKNDYPDKVGTALFKEAGVTLIVLKK